MITTSVVTGAELAPVDESVFSQEEQAALDPYPMSAPSAT
jgi:hypothetical protein